MPLGGTRLTGSAQGYEAFERLEVSSLRQGNIVEHDCKISSRTSCRREVATFTSTSRTGAASILAGVSRSASSFLPMATGKGAAGANAWATTVCFPRRHARFWRSACLCTLVAPLLTQLAWCSTQAGARRWPEHSHCMVWPVVQPGPRLLGVACYPKPRSSQRLPTI